MFRPGEVALPWITSLSQIQNTFEILQLRTNFETLMVLSSRIIIEHKFQMIEGFKPRTSRMQEQ